MSIIREKRVHIFFQTYSATFKELLFFKTLLTGGLPNSRGYIQNKAKFVFKSLSILFYVCSVHAQPKKELVSVVVAPNHVDWQYNIGDEAIFTINVFKNNIPVDGTVKYTIKPEKMNTLDEGIVKLRNGTAVIKASSLKEPGFLRCYAEVEVDNHTYSSYSTAGYAVESIRPTTTLPDDFVEFWAGWKQKLADVPIQPLLKLLPERCTDKVDVYEVSMNNIHGKIYGILCKPKKEGRYPAILTVPGAGVRPYKGDVANATQGFVTLQIGIHGIPVTLDQRIYDDLGNGALRNYPRVFLDDKDNYYYNRVYLGCIRAVDFIFTLDEFDGKNIAITGGSQGGALSIVTAGLDSRITCLAAIYPALSDLTGYLENRAGGWPHMFQTQEKQLKSHVENSKYYDVVNFARFIKAPGWYTWGFNDPTCPPTSIFAAYNVINVEKEKHIFPDTQHWTYPEQQELKIDWLYGRLRK